MAKQKDFDSFLSNIEPSNTTVSYISSVQNNLRTYLESHSTYKDFILETFLSGSYAKHTAIRPVSGEKKRDVDIIVVTKYTSEKSSVDVINELCDILKEKDTYCTATIQSHSIGIEMGGISVDVVPVIVDSDDDSLYYIGDSTIGDWNLTDPKGHKTWSTKVNTDNNSKYKPLVKIFKWWRRYNCPIDVKYPKGITLEKIIADNLGDSSFNTEDFLISTIQNIISKYKEDYVDVNINPIVDDPSDKIIDNDLLSGYSVDDFSSFILKLSEHADLLNANGTDNDVWREILGTEFPKSSSTNLVKQSFSKTSDCLTASHRQAPTWPIARGGAAFISTRITSPSGLEIEYKNNGESLAKGCSLRFRALTGVKPPYRVVWQIVNTGEEAKRASCLRGGFENSDGNDNEKMEKTLYSGSHSVQCFIIKRGVCVAKSKEFIINIV